MRRLEVRCCCQPTKLLGSLPVPGEVRDGQTLRFVLSPPRWVKDSIAAPPHRVQADIIALPVATLVTYDFRDGRAPVPVRRIAMKSEETPIERLRLIPGFVEAR